MDEAEKIKIIAEHYGYDSQSRQCIEEMAELTQAINKWWRVCGNGQRTEKSIAEMRDNWLKKLRMCRLCYGRSNTCFFLHRK